TFRDALRRVRAAALAAYDHRDLSWERLGFVSPAWTGPRALQLARITANFLRMPPALVAGGVELELCPPAEHRAKCDLTLYMRERGDTLEMTFVFNTDLYEPSRMAWMLGQLEGLLASGAATPDQRISRLALRGGEERRPADAGRGAVCTSRAAA